MALREARRRTSIDVNDFDRRAAAAQRRCDEIASAGRADERDAPAADISQLGEREQTFAVEAIARNNRASPVARERMRRTGAGREHAIMFAHVCEDIRAEAHGGRAREDPVVAARDGRDPDVPRRDSDPAA